MLRDVRIRTYTRQKCRMHAKVRMVPLQRNEMRKEQCGDPEGDIRSCGKGEKATYLPQKTASIKHGFGTFSIHLIEQPVRLVLQHISPTGDPTTKNMYICNSTLYDLYRNNTKILDDFNLEQRLFSTFIPRLLPLSIDWQTLRSMSVKYKYIFHCRDEIERPRAVISQQRSTYLALEMLNFLLLWLSSFGGSAYNHRTTNAKNPTMTLHRPAIQGHAPLMAQDLGHSSCAKWRTVTCLFSSMLVSQGRL